MCVLYAGADEETATVFREKLKFPSPGECGDVSSELRRTFESRGMIRGEQVEEGAHISIAQSLWFPEEMKLSPEYINLIGDSFDTEKITLRSTSYPATALHTFLEWFDLADSGLHEFLVLPRPDEFVIAGKLDFSGYWWRPFDVYGDDDFHLVDDRIVKVNMMQRYNRMEFARGDAYWVVQLYYSNKLDSIILIVPDEGLFSNVEEYLDESKVLEALGRLKPINSQIRLPILDFRCTINLKDVLSVLGIPGMDESMDSGFSGMTLTEGSPKVEYLVQSTSMEMAIKNSSIRAPEPVKEIMPDTEDEENLHINRPFIFLVRDIPTDTILVMGRIMDPTETDIALDPHPEVSNPINSDS